MWCRWDVRTVRSLCLFAPRLVLQNPRLPRVRGSISRGQDASMRRVFDKWLLDSCRAMLKTEPPSEAPNFPLSATVSVSDRRSRAQPSKGPSRTAIGLEETLVRASCCYRGSPQKTESDRCRIRQAPVRTAAL